MSHKSIRKNKKKKGWIKPELKRLESKKENEKKEKEIQLMKLQLSLTGKNKGELEWLADTVLFWKGKLVKIDSTVNKNVQSILLLPLASV